MFGFGEISGSFKSITFQNAIGYIKKDISFILSFRFSFNSINLFPQ